MKILLIVTLTILATTSTYAFKMSRHYPSELPNCPASNEELLELTRFIPSANSKSNKGICYVKATYYSWWDLINPSKDPYEIEVNAGVCNSNHFINFKDNLKIKATVSYKGKVSMCGSSPGCHYECQPIIELWPF